MSCPTNCIGWDEDKLSMHDDITDALARGSAAEVISALLMERAVILFRARDDEKAEMIRELSDMVADYRKRQDEALESAKRKFNEEYQNG